MAWKNRGLYGNQTLTNNLEDLEEYLDELEAIVGELVPKTRVINAGNGLTGTGDLSADITLNVGAGSGIAVDASGVWVDYTVLDLVYSGIAHNHTGVYSSASHNHDSWYSAVGHAHSGVYEPVDATILRTASVSSTPTASAWLVPISSGWAYAHTTAADPHSVYVLENAVDDTPVNGAMDPISSNWAYDHEAATDPHSAAGYTRDSVAEVVTATWRFSNGISLGADADVVVTNSGDDMQVRVGASSNYGYATFSGSGTTMALKFNGTQVVRSRVTGWGAPTGTATRSTFATSTVTLPQLAERVKALIDDLTTHGLIG